MGSFICVYRYMDKIGIEEWREIVKYWKQFKMFINRELVR